MRKLFIIIGLILPLLGCEDNDPEVDAFFIDLTEGTTAASVDYPSHFPEVFPSQDNPLTEEGIYLGRKLFFDPILSEDFSVSCASCHDPGKAFSDAPKVLSDGINGNKTEFNSMAIINLAWMNEFFWDGRAKSRQEQAFLPVTNPNEMGFNWPDAVERLQNDPEYVRLFTLAFETPVIDSVKVAKALVQYEMTLNSGNTRFDKWWRGEVALEGLEIDGQAIFYSEIADCFHCHGNVLTTDNDFHNTGLDDDASLKPGLFSTTGNADDYGKFKTPTLRNWIYTAPYMHDGRFNTIEEVIEFYSTGVKVNQTIDPLMKKAHQGGVQLNKFQREALLAFLETMNEPELATD